MKTIASIPEVPATKFRAEFWTTVFDANGSHEVWAVIMLDGSDAGHGCAFGAKEPMEQYADRLNESKGVL